MMLQLGIKLPNISSIAEREPMLRLAQAAEALGYDSVWVADHVVIPRETRSEHPYGAGPELTNSLDPLVSLGFVAACTERVRLGTAVLVVPYRNPLLTAKMLASIDVLSGGRLTLGAGTGWLEDEFTALQAPPFPARGAVVEEWISIFRACWQDESPSHNGVHYAFTPVDFRPKPVARIPILIGGNSNAALRRAATVGDGWLGSRVEPSDAADHVHRLRTFAADASRDHDELTVGCGYIVSIEERVAPPSPDLRGTLPQILERIAELEDAGFQHLELRFATMRGADASVDRTIEAMEALIRAVR
jgi:probable F420-dependent oxidoreductase